VQIFLDNFMCFTVRVCNKAINLRGAAGAPPVAKWLCGWIAWLDAKLGKIDGSGILEFSPRLWKTVPFNFPKSFVAKQALRGIDLRLSL